MRYKYTLSKEFYVMHERVIQLTKDGSHTFFIPKSNITYHSTHGAIQESKYVFINAGLEYFFTEKKNDFNAIIKVFEVGFGTGLNALLTLEFTLQKQQSILYETIEVYPLSQEEFQQLNYTSLVNKNLNDSFNQLHECDWNKITPIHQYFSFKKIKADLELFNTEEKFHIIYFDAFDPNNQPELWTESIFKKMYDMLLPNGILVTYCSKGVVRRAMQAAGFTIEKLKGPPGKREIVRATKSIKHESLNA